MLKAKVNNQFEFTLDKESGLNMIETGYRTFHILKDHKSYRAEVLKADKDEKTFVIRVNGNKYTIKLTDKYDELLEKLGMSSAASAKVKDMKAPMPGLVVDVRVKEGDAVKQGDGLVVLQAMKMENIIKSPADGTIKKVNIKKGDAVEKNQVMITFG